MTDLHRLDKQNIWHPFTPLTGSDDPLLITSAEGVYLNTHDGRRIMDCISSWWVNIHGHSNPEIADAIAAQARKLEHVIFAGFTHEPAITLSKNLLSILPPNMKRIFFSDDGSTSVEVGIKMALQYWHNRNKQKRKIIAIDGAYHGDTFGAMSVGERGLFTDPFRKFLFDVEFIPFPHGNDYSATVNAFERIARSGDVALFIYEPLVQGASGMRIYSTNCLAELLEIARDYDIVTLADEVFTGFGRTGKYFASDYADVKPDIMAVSKGITGGTMPLGVTACSGRILEAFETDVFSKAFFHGHSYTGNPIACAAANASFKILTRESTLRQIEIISSQHQIFVSKVANHPAVNNARTIGTILSIELKSVTESGYENKLRKRIYTYFIDRDILLRPLGNIFYVLPPYIISIEQLELVYTTILAFLESLEVTKAE